MYVSPISSIFPVKHDYELQTQIFFISVLYESESFIFCKFNSQVDFDLVSLSLVHSCAFLSA